MDRDEWDRITSIARGRASKSGLLEGGETYPETGLTVAEVGAVQEFGTDRIPARPFIGSTFDARRPLLQARARLLLGEVLDGRMSMDEGALVLGKEFAEMVRSAILDVPLPGIAPPNASAYAAEKLARQQGERYEAKDGVAYDKKSGEAVDAPQFVRTLVDTRKMVDSLAAELE